MAHNDRTEQSEQCSEAPYEVPVSTEPPCGCDGCWACRGYVPGCTCDVDWDKLAGAL